ncbi:MAG TPA: shikimate kinase [bacterium]|jgi:shikimate kinase
MGLIFLTGMTGSGKTVVGEKLAAKLGIAFIDLDAKVARTTGRKIPQIFAEEGESAFREQEALALRRVAKTPEGVVALGAGALERQASFELVHAHGALVYLRASVDLLVERLHVLNDRPLLAGADTAEDLKARLREMLARRERHYLTAQIVIDIDDQTSVESTVDRICQILKPSS